MGSLQILHSLPATASEEPGMTEKQRSSEV
jgi:hypothetical protein